MQPDDRVDDQQPDGRDPMTAFVASDEFLGGLVWGALVVVIIGIGVDAACELRRKRRGSS